MHSIPKKRLSRSRKIDPQKRGQIAAVGLVCEFDAGCRVTSRGRGDKFASEGSGRIIDVCRTVASAHQIRDRTMQSEKNPWL